MRRPGAQSIVGNPVLVGAVTTLIVVVAVFLAYNANNGLPFVPTQQLKFQMPNGGNLIRGNDVREGGYRIGIVDRMKAMPLPDGSVGAEVVLKLDQKAGEIPRDSTISIRPRSVLGLKYVEVTRGKSEEVFREGDTIPAAQTHVPVELDQFYNIFDEDTRSASRENLHGFGDALALRGVSLNQTIAELPRFLRYLEPVMRNLSDRETRLDRFFAELGDAARIVSPVAERYAHGFTAGADTFEAWSRHPEELKETISRSVPTMRDSITSFRVQRPFLRDFALFSRSLERAAGEMPRSLPRITRALRTGVPVLRRTPDINNRLRDALADLEDLMEAPTTNVALQGLTAAKNTLNPTVKFLGPYITVCNYLTYAFTHASEHLTEEDPTGGSQRSLLNQAPRPRQGNNSLGAIGASEPANGEDVVSGARVNLHTNLYSAAVDRQGNADCESGQRGYIHKANATGDPKYNIVVDPHIPGNQGPTFTGRPRVPEGQTFSRTPLQGPPMPRELDP